MIEQLLQLLGNTNFTSLVLLVSFVVFASFYFGIGIGYWLAKSKTQPKPQLSNVTVNLDTHGVASKLAEEFNLIFVKK